MHYIHADKEDQETVEAYLVVRRI